MATASRILGSLVAIGLLAVAVSACGLASADEQAQPVGDVRVGSVAQLAQCTDWAEGTRDERLATIEDIREQINLQDGPVKAPELSDDAAYEVLDNTCANDFAASFRLYKIYAKATAFASFTQ